MMAAIIRILYVDDEPTLLDIGKMFLEKSGEFTVTTALSAPEAIRLLEQEKFDAIISDYQMPEMDGIQFLVEVRSRFGPIPFILFTGRGREEIVIQAINSGADFYLQKGGEPKSQFAELSHKIMSAASRKRAEDALRESEAKYHNVIEDQTEFISRFLPDGMHIFVNDAYCRYFGVAREDILGHRFMPALYEEDRKAVAAFFATLTLNNPVGTIDQRTIMPDGSTRWQRWSDRAIFDADGKLVEYQSVGRDITAQKEAEIAIKRSEAQLNAIIQSSPIPKFVIDKDHRVIHWNKALEAYSGIKEKEIIGTNQHWRAFYTEERPCMADLILDGTVEKLSQWYAGKYAKSKLIEGAYEATDFFPHMGITGTWLFFTASVIKDDDGNILGAIETLEDSTETHLKTEELNIAYQKIQNAFDLVKESEVQYRNIVEDQTEFISRFLPDGTHIFVNDAYCRYFGIAREDILGHRFRPVIHSDDRKAVAGFFATLTLKNPVGIIDQRTIMPDGSTRWQRWSDRAIFDADGNVVQYQSVGRDITEYKQAEAALKEREEQLHLAIDSANLGLWDMNLINGEMVHNQRWAEMLGFSMNELEKPSEWWGQRVHPEDYQNITNISDLHRAGKIPFFDAIYRMKHKNEEWRWVHSKGKIISWDSDGVALRMIGVNQDITGQKLVELDILKKNEELKTSHEELTATSEELHQTLDDLTQSEHKLRESEERLNFAIESAHLGLWDLNFVTYDVVHNRQWTEMLGFSRAEMDKPSSWWQERVHPEDSARVSKSSEDHVAGRAPYFDSIYRMKHKNGSWRWLHSVGKVVSKDSKGRPLRMIGINEDITERKNTEEKLNEREEKYRTIFENAGDAIAIHNINGQFIEVNDIICKRLGYTREELLTMTVEDIDDPVHARNVEGRIKELSKKGHIVFETVHIARDGRKIPIEASAVIFHIDGKPFIMSIARDITGRKVAEESLQQANKKLTLLSSLTRHDIKNQLTVLLGYLDILEQKQSDPTLTEYFQKLTNAANRISSLIQFTKEYERIGTTIPVWQDTRNLVENAIKQAPLGQVVVKNELPVCEEVFADPLIVKVYYNLMDNAVRYGGKITTIRFSVEEHGDDHVIVCEDDGVGVALEDKEKIFERGFGKNTGLGLALSKEILSITGITIKETGEPGKGARFEMVVPKGAWRRRITGNDA